MSLEVLIAGFVVVTLVTAVQGSVGFGANLLAMPIMVQIDPNLVPGPTLLATALVNVLVVCNEREHVQLQPISQALMGRAIGTIVAAGALGYLSQRGVGFMIAFMVLGAVALTAFGITAKRTRRNMVTAGAISGFGSTTSGIGGPPVALLFTDVSGPQIRASLATYFLIGTMMTLTALTIVGRFEPQQATAAIFLVPASVVGYILSRPLSKIIDKGYARPAIMALSSIAAIILLVRLLAG